FSNLVDDHFILDRRVIGGMQQVSELMAADLGDTVVRLNSPVRTIDWSGDPVVVSTDDAQFAGTDVIVAVPPNLYSRITYVPHLPRLQQVFHQHQSMGLVIKVHATYPRPFWRDAGLSGTGFG
ncbi:putrescine oxidase, partial [Burkholderia multivorans]